ncbi:permease-like cell division protein FtsX [Thioflexithrix psekupsensis]|uniref:Cell division protein FtsX n=1 Tax=Thioflexithrix psekupsensis TaxID=1570016 RepID=A0A251XBF6_9GAMM|nr:permease-like cell division protein FtsX [Thioflexithrix psekupsensis]OUD15664.1 cell division protein FtsX [Thioflexithrix psekupsensis]
MKVARPSASRSTTPYRPPAPPKAPAAKPRTAANNNSTGSHAWLTHHFYVFFSSLGQFARAPLQNIMAAAVIGVALALPAGFYLLLENVQNISRNWGGTLQISLFLQADATPEAIQTLSDQLSQRADIQSVQVILPEQALQEYRNLSGFSDALTALNQNPLPAVLVIQPKQTTEGHAPPQSLLDDLAQLPAVDIAQHDMRWLQRLSAMLEIAKRGVLVLAGLLALTVLLVVGNTIRLSIENRREEIEINKLFGATDGFIRRPFLYSGFWYGLLGAIIAWLLVYLAFALLEHPVQQLTALYYSEFTLMRFDWRSSLLLLAAGIFLGLAGAWLAVGRHLRDINPR